MQNDKLAARQMSLLIVGAGLSGLMMAAQCLRCGLYPTLIDQRHRPMNATGTIFLNARTLELLDQMGLSQVVLAQGNRISRLCMLSSVEHMDFSQSDPSTTAFPYVLAIQTAKLEKLLIDYITAKACKIYWNTQLLSMSESERGVDVEVSHSELTESWKTQWMVAADGRNSFIRNSLEITVESADFNHHYFQVEISMKSDQVDMLEEMGEHEDVQIWVANGQILSALPLKHDNRTLLCGIRPRHPFSEKEITTNLHKSLGHLSSGIQFNLDSQTLCTGQLHRQTATKFAERRVFLVGDAAHNFPSIMSHGVNSAFLDTWNLGWKLAGVIQGRIGKKVLLTYHGERYSQARKSLGLQRPLQGLASAEILVRLMQYAPGLATQLLPLLIKYWAEPKRLSRLFSRHAGLQVTYRHSALAVHYGRSERVRAGDRFPWFPLYDERRKFWTHTHAALEKPNFVLIILGNASPHTLHILGQWIKQKYPQGLSLFYIPFSQANYLLFEHFELNKDQIQAVLVRPDTHIAYMTNFLHTPLIDDYLGEAMDWKLHHTLNSL